MTNASADAVTSNTVSGDQDKNKDTLTAANADAVTSNAKDTSTTANADAVNAGAATSNAVGGDQDKPENKDTFNISPSLSFNDAPLSRLSPHFTGRQQELAQIMKAFEAVREDGPTRFALVGNPGVGKSQLTYTLAKESFAQGRYKCIFWISATTSEKLHQGFSRLLHLVEHPDRSVPEEAVKPIIAQNCLEEFNAGRWLLVLDNVTQETVELLQIHLPRKNKLGNILITTHNEDVATEMMRTPGEQHEILELRIPSVKDAVSILRGHFKEGELKADESKVNEFVECVGCLPFAIAQAAVYMRESGSTLDALLTVCKSEHKINMTRWENDLTLYQERSVAAMFYHQLDDLQRNSPTVSNFLKTIAFFDAESIPLDMLTTGAGVVSKAQQEAAAAAKAIQKRASLMRKVTKKLHRLAKWRRKGRSDDANTVQALLELLQIPMGPAITQLQNRFLIVQQEQKADQSSSLWMHNLTQLMVLDKMKRDGAEQEWFEFAVELACGAFGEVQDPESAENWPRCEVLIPHIRSLIKRQGLATDTDNSLLDAKFRIAGYLKSRGRFNEAEELYNQVLLSREGQLGAEHVTTLITRHSLADVYVSQGRYTDAEVVYQQVLVSREQQLGPEYVDTLTTKHSLAVVYNSQGRFSEAEGLLIDVLAGREKSLGLSHSDTQDSQRLLADVNTNRGTAAVSSQD